jgi:hypothetical protein
MGNMTMPKLTKKVVEATIPQEKDLILWDSEIAGFLCKITPAGKRSYFLYYRTQGRRQRRPKIGDHGVITAEQARGIAQKWLLEVSQGNDPSAAKKEVHFRSGYPVNGRLSKETFYEVVEDGAKFQLINYRFIYLADSYQYGGTAKKVFTEKEELYVFDVAFGKISKIKRTEADVLNALPDLKEKIASIVSKNKLKLKLNEDMKKLFTELNK